MNILPEMKIVGLTLYLEKSKTLVIGDLHIGYEEALNKQGVLIPRMHLKDIISHLEKVFKKVSPESIVLIGDIKHEFGRISDQEWDDSMTFLRFLLKKSKVILLKGNHDIILGPIVDNINLRTQIYGMRNSDSRVSHKKNLEVKDYVMIGDTFLCHGDKLFDENKDFKKSKKIIIGHEHPAISIKDGSRIEKFKCFLLGTYKRKKLIVIPSVNFVTEGTDVLQEKLLSPFIKNILKFKAFVIGDKVYDFGQISRFKP